MDSAARLSFLSQVDELSCRSSYQDLALQK